MATAHTAGHWGEPPGVFSEVPKTTRFTVFLRFGVRKTLRFTAFLRLRVRWSVGVRTTGHWGEPPGVVSEAPTRGLERASRLRLVLLRRFGWRQGVREGVASAGLWRVPWSEAATKTMRFTAFLRFGVRETLRFTAFLRLRVRWSVGVRATGHWGEPPGVVSEVPPRCPRPFPRREFWLGLAPSGSNVAPRKRRDSAPERPR